MHNTLRLSALSPNGSIAERWEFADQQALPKMSRVPFTYLGYGWGRFASQSLSGGERAGTRRRMGAVTRFRERGSRGLCVDRLSPALRRLWRGSPGTHPERDHPGLPVAIEGTALIRRLFLTVARLRDSTTGRRRSALLTRRGLIGVRRPFECALARPQCQRVPGRSNNPRSGAKATDPSDLMAQARQPTFDAVLQMIPARIAHTRPPKASAAENLRAVPADAERETVVLTCSAARYCCTCGGMAVCAETGRGRALPVDEPVHRRH